MFYVLFFLERKRRDHIKDSFTGLKDSIPTLQVRRGQLDSWIPETVIYSHLIIV